MFHYNSYWRHWSRVLATPHTCDNYIELNLTPINGNWEDVKPVVIRTHCTRRDRRDKDVMTLPEDVRQEMVEHLGADFTNYLISHDFMGEIDMEKLHNEMRGGGVPFVCVRRDLWEDLQGKSISPIVGRAMRQVEQALQEENHNLAAERAGHTIMLLLNQCSFDTAHEFLKAYEQKIWGFCYDKYHSK